MFMICELVLRVGLPFYSETHKPDLTTCTVGSRKIFIVQLNNSKEIENSRFNSLNIWIKTVVYSHFVSFQKASLNEWVW